jgi:hypothetical protein
VKQIKQPSSSNLAAVIAIGLLASFGLPSPANAAATAPCPPGTPLAQTILAPPTVAFGRKFTAKLEYVNETGWFSVGPANFSYGPITGGGPIAGEFIRSVSGVDDLSPEIVFTRGAAPGKFSASWIQETGSKSTKPPTYVECEATTSASPTPIVGKLSPVRPRIVNENGDSSFNLVARCPERQRFSDVEVTQPSTAPVKLELRGAGSHGTAKTLDVCNWTWEGTLKTRAWSVRGGSSLDSGSQWLTVESGLLEARRPSRMRFRGSQAGVELAKGRFSMIWEIEGWHTIFDGTDAFVNYCIDEGRTIRSTNGRLHCRYPGYFRQRTFGLHWSK